MNIIKSTAAFVCALLLWSPLAGAESKDEQQLDRMFARSTLQIATPDAKLHKFDVWVADTDARRMRGLMFVDKLADDEGMLFIYPQQQQISMWMKNTYIPLDMIFIRADGRILRIAENTEPMSTKIISSGGLARGVLEVIAGTAQKYGIQPGDRVAHPLFNKR